MTVPHMYVIEYQKCGLPHIHILLIMANEENLVTAEDVDEVINAELPPNPNKAGISEEEKGTEELHRTNCCNPHDPDCLFRRRQ